MTSELLSNPYSKFPPDGFTPLMNAAFDGDLSTLKRLLQGGADPNSLNRFGSTAVFWAAEAGREEAARQLVQAGANLLYINRMRQNVESWARYNGHYRLAYLFRKEIIRQFYEMLRNPPKGAELEDMIKLQRAHRINKSEVIDYFLSIKREHNEKYSELQYAIARDENCKPANLLSAYVHHSQGSGFKRFFCLHPTLSHAVARIEAEIEEISLFFSALRNLVRF